ncbi:NLP/P60 protein [Shewanella sediminis HAW-EB3]|uniref:NLP/P60 protein n=1 Tax=Shewanella sediminis (strain HAW-EB3) TaxID=425104 RepID=A8G1U4_SHESH|nr:NlpC/P60 family protein [Shewanella sediminis]ABV39067.1 NLP/P60 protein [Shewanella sediminis HAW-EB3]
MLKPLLILLSILLLSACGSLPPEPDTKASNQLERQLMAFHQEWRGTPYRLGGMNKRGVDCSGFVYLAYKELLGQAIPRTTSEQLHSGAKVSKDRLNAGDLVFFKTGWTTRHVGIYLSDSKFLHASTSQGVMISTLENSYWKRKYWLSRRL